MCIGYLFGFLVDGSQPRLQLLEPGLQLVPNPTLCTHLAHLSRTQTEGEVSSRNTHRQDLPRIESEHKSCHAPPHSHMHSYAHRHTPGLHHGADTGSTGTDRKHCCRSEASSLGPGSGPVQTRPRGAASSLQSDSPGSETGWPGRTAARETGKGGSLHLQTKEGRDRLRLWG